jgi:hypothetical protein
MPFPGWAPPDADDAALEGGSRTRYRPSRPSGIGWSSEMQAHNPFIYTFEVSRGAHLQFSFLVIQGVPDLTVVIQRYLEIAVAMFKYHVIRVYAAGRHFFE